MRGDAAETQVLREIGMHAPQTRHHRTYAEERCWKDERGFHCVRPESLSDRSQNCGTIAGCWHNLEEEYPQIEMRVSRCCQTATLSHLLVNPLRISKFAYFSLLSLTCRLHAVATLDYVCFEGYRPRCAMKFEEEATCVAEDGSHLVASPERCGGCSAVLTYWL